MARRIDGTIHPKTVVLELNWEGEHKTCLEEKLREPGSHGRHFGQTRICINIKGGDV